MVNGNGGEEVEGEYTLILSYSVSHIDSKEETGKGKHRQETRTPQCYKQTTMFFYRRRSQNKDFQGLIPNRRKLI